jgi:soluble lytic murein transglycosylase
MADDALPPDPSAPDPNLRRRKTDIPAHSAERRRWRLKTGVAAAVAVVVLLVPTGIFWSMARPVLHKDIIDKYAAVYKFDPLFVMALVKVESRFLKTARSHRGAIGLMQLMPETALEMARRMGMRVTLEEVEDPQVNILLGYHYLSLLRDEFKDDKVAMLAAYNAGPGKVREWRKAGLLTEAGIPFRETRDFVHRVITTHRWLKRFQRLKNVIDA